MGTRGRLRSGLPETFLSIFVIIKPPINISQAVEIEGVAINRIEFPVQGNILLEKIARTVNRNFTEQNRVDRKQRFLEFVIKWPVLVAFCQNQGPRLNVATIFIQQPGPLQIEGVGIAQVGRRDIVLNNDGRLLLAPSFSQKTGKSRFGKRKIGRLANCILEKQDIVLPKDIALNRGPDDKGKNRG